MGATPLRAIVIECLEGDSAQFAGIRVDGVRCQSEPTSALPALLWWAAQDGDSRVLWLWHHQGPCGEAVGVGGDVA